MAAKRLTNAPLVEAIVELRWEPLEQGEAGTGPAEASFPLLLGKVAEAFKGEYPFHEPTPTASWPPEVAAQMHFVQHRFRRAKGGWPLVQVGPTAFTVNETSDYDWSGDFRGRAVCAVGSFLRLLAEAEGGQPVSLLLRYIDAIPFDYEDGSVLEFFAGQLKTEITFPEGLFAETGVDRRPGNLDLRTSFRCGEPAGTANLRLASGLHKGAKAVLMETMVQSQGEDLPDLPGGFGDWLDRAHEIPSRWFRELAAGDLLRSFGGE